MALYDNPASRQRGAAWYESMASSVGGSELAGAMDKGAYKSFYDVVVSKIKLRRGVSDFNGGPACWWGVLFEDVIAAYVAVDLGAKVLGDEICIREIAHHRNSPDGYCVAKFYRDDDGRLVLWTSDLPRDAVEACLTLLLEFKCPMSRKPKGRIPPDYKIQVESGLAVSPVAHQGLYVEAVFRKCRLEDLGDSAAYDDEYHASDRGAWELPVGWGLIGVYAPGLDAPLHVRLGWAGREWAEGDPSPCAADADAASAAWDVGARLGDAGGHGVADLGRADAKLFNRALGLIETGRFRVIRVAPCFADGRGRPLDAAATVAALRRLPPRRAPGDPTAAHFRLVAVLPWKLFEVAYHPVRRVPGFGETIRAATARVFDAVAAAEATPDPFAHVRNLAHLDRIASGKPLPASRIDEGDVQSLFDAFSAAEESAAKIEAAVG